MAGAPVTLNQYDLAGTAGQAALAALKAANKLPVGNTYSVTAATDTFEPSGAIKMRYSAAAPALLGVPEASLGIYAFNESGDLYQLPYQTLDKDNKVLTARVPSPAYSLFAVLASSTQAENIPPSVYPDGIPPETTISFGGISAPASDGVYSSSVTTLLFSAADPQVPDVITSGVNLTNYILEPDSATVQISTYTAPFTLPEGVHPMYYMSVDNAGNYEFPRATTIYIDATPPVTRLAGDPLYTEGGKKYAAAGKALALQAEDIPSNGVASGPSGTFYLVDVASGACPSLLQLIADPPASPPVFSGAPGTCENPLFTAPFTLAEGTHSLTYFSLDRVGNSEAVKNGVLYLDGTAPETGLKIGSAVYSGQGTAYITETDSVTITAADLVSNGVISGLATTYLLIDIAPEICQSGGTGGGVNGLGSCVNPLYTEPFTLPVGTHTVYYSAADNVGNQAAVKSVTITVSAKDITPQESARRAAELSCPV